MTGRNSNKIPLLIYSFNTHFDWCKSVRRWTKFTDLQLEKQGTNMFLSEREARDAALEPEEMVLVAKMVSK